MRCASTAGRATPRGRRRSSPTPTSAAASTWSRWRAASPTGPVATPSMPPRWPWSGRALAGLASSLGERDVPLETWRVDGQEEAGAAGERRAARLLERIAERVGTAPLFGGGNRVGGGPAGALPR